MLTNLRLIIDLPESFGKRSEEFYGKVIKDESVPPNGFAIRLTAVPLELKAYFKQLYQPN